MSHSFPTHTHIERHPLTLAYMHKGGCVCYVEGISNGVSLLLLSCFALVAIAKIKKGTKSRIGGLLNTLLLSNNIFLV